MLNNPDNSNPARDGKLIATNLWCGEMLQVKGSVDYVGQAVRLPGGKVHAAKR
jgi:hypothetical protein